MLLNSSILLLQKIHLLKTIIIRFFSILFKRKKEIELLYLDYKTESIFSLKNGKDFEYTYIIVNYKFNNGIYYRFGKIKTTQKNTIILDVEYLDKEIELTIYGFFRKKKYLLNLQSKYKLNSNNFKTGFNNLKLQLQEQTLPKLAHPTIYKNIEKPIINNQKIKIKNKSIKISTNKFNQNDFI